MWGVDPELLCRQHLLGEHVEMHMFYGTIKKGKSINGYIKGGLVDPSLIEFRHDVLANEMMRRGYNHKSPMNFDLPLQSSISLDIERNKEVLRNRCIECKNRGI